MAPHRNELMHVAAADHGVHRVQPEVAHRNTDLPGARVGLVHVDDLEDRRGAELEE